MAFEWPLFVSLLQNIGETSGEDKEIEFRIVRQRIPVAFLDGQYVYDEKVAHQAVFSKQRSRWLATQVEFFEKYFIEGWFQLFRGNLAFFNKVFQTYLLPRVMLVAVTGLWFIWTLFFAHWGLPSALILLALLAFSLLLGIPAKWYNRELLQAFLQIPGALFSMLKAMLHIGKARKTFIHTPHGEQAKP
jgi:cellulose synthase/poly-beta-1,6-N-acetylglucosamine synthase-like glycosyltransferase